MIWRRDHRFDNHVYDVIAAEVRTGEIADALWARALVKAGGEESATRAAYIELRAQQLRRELKERGTQQKAQQRVLKRKERDRQRLTRWRWGVGVIGLGGIGAALHGTGFVLTVLESWGFQVHLDWVPRPRDFGGWSDFAFVGALYLSLVLLGGGLAVSEKRQRRSGFIKKWGEDPEQKL